MRMRLAFAIGNSMSNLKRKAQSRALPAFFPAKKQAVPDHSELSTSKEWECSACTYSNASSTLACDVCQTPRGDNTVASLAQNFLSEPKKLPTKASSSAPSSAHNLVPKTPSGTENPCNFAAEALAAALEAGSATPGAVKPTYLTCGGDSWYILARGYWPSPDQATFDEQWNLHPETFHNLTIAGRTLPESRWSTVWGRSYTYSGATNPMRPIAPEQDGALVAALIARANALTSSIAQQPSTSGEVRGSDRNKNEANSSRCNNSRSNSYSKPYNGCLQNWYLPEHSIGLHADDQRAMKPGIPIFSLSWGGPRRFLFRAKPAYLPDSAQPSPMAVTAAKVELLLRDGDLLVMGGTCQKTHKHEVPKLRKTMDLPTGRRINWTIRAFA